MKLGHHDPFDYFPLYEDLRPSSMGIKKIKFDPQNIKTKIFQFDKKFNQVRKHKLSMRENESFYYRTINSKSSEELRLKSVLKIIDILSKENTEEFKITTSEEGINCVCVITKEVLSFNLNGALIKEKTLSKINYQDSFDALAMNLMEDIVVMSVEDGKDYASTISVFNANGWSADGEIGRSFDKIHENIPGIEKAIPNTQRMLQALLNSSEPFERVAAISFRTDTELNKHPVLGEPNIPFSKKNESLVIRLERQTVTSLETGFLFTIKTYFMDFSKCNKTQQEGFLRTFEKNDPNIYSHVFISRYRKLIIPWIKRQLFRK